MPRSLATAGLPPRVRKALEVAVGAVTDALEPRLDAMLGEFEEELFRLADQARNPGMESGYMQTLRAFRLNRADLVPRFILEVEAAAAAIRKPADTPRPAAEAARARPAQSGFGTLSLVDEAVMDEGLVLREIASRQEGRAALPLHLLGQRFGVLAGTPAFDAERLPLGPQAICRAMGTVAKALDIEHDSRLLLYRIFDRHVMAGYPRVLERLDELLDEEGILPGLTHVPVRVRPSPQPAGEPREGAADAAASGTPAPGFAAPRPAADPQRPYTAWPGEPAAGAADEDEDAASGEQLQQLQQLLDSRRHLLGKLRPGGHAASGMVISTEDVSTALGHLQAQPLSVAGAPQTLADVKQTLLAQARQRSGVHSELSPRDNDTFELLGMLFGNLEEELRADAPATALVKRLQIPLLRVALKDSAFFVRSRHPARQLLDTVAESAARWLDGNDFDPQLLAPLQGAVSHVVEQYDDDIDVFSDCNARLQGHLQAQVRKAELLEKRHADAARGKEKLEVAKLRAAEVMTEVVGDQRLPHFSRALLNQSWADVLTLTLLRQGEGSEAWARQVEATRRIAEACTREDAPRDPELVVHIESALAQVGYHGDEASVIAQRLTSNRADDADEDPASRTELAMKLKARTRLGEEADRRKPAPSPRTPEEEARYEQLRVLPFGTWIEFTTNQQGDVVRRRLSWYSLLTGNALFVNSRGQRVGEQSLDSVARLLAAGQARIVASGQARLVDRAWQAAMHALRSFAGLGERNGDDAEAGA